MQLRTAILVAIEADTGLRFGDQHRILGRVQAVATGAGLFGPLVLAALPVNAGSRFMTVQAGLVLGLGGGFLAEDDGYQAFDAWRLVVRGEVAVATAAEGFLGLATDRLAGRLRRSRVTHDGVLGLVDREETLVALGTRLGVAGLRARPGFGSSGIGGLGAGDSWKSKGDEEREAGDNGATFLDGLVHLPISDVAFARSRSEISEPRLLDSTAILTNNFINLRFNLDSNRLFPN